MNYSLPHLAGFRRTAVAVAALCVTSCSSAPQWQWDHAPGLQVGLGPITDVRHDSSRLHGLRVHIQPAANQSQLWAFKATVFDDRNHNQCADPSEILHVFSGTGRGAERVHFPRLHLPGQPLRVAALASLWSVDGQSEAQVFAPSEP